MSLHQILKPGVDSSNKRNANCSKIKSKIHDPKLILTSIANSLGEKLHLYQPALVGVKSMRSFQSGGSNGNNPPSKLLNQKNSAPTLSKTNSVTMYNGDAGAELNSAARKTRRSDRNNSNQKSSSILKVIEYISALPPKANALNENCSNARISSSVDFGITENESKQRKRSQSNISNVNSLPNKKSLGYHHAQKFSSSPKKILYNKHGLPANGIINDSVNDQGNKNSNKPHKILKTATAATTIRNIPYNYKTPHMYKDKADRLIYNLKKPKTSIHPNSEYSSFSDLKYPNETLIDGPEVEALRNKVNFVALKKHDPFVKRIIDMTTHVVFFEFEDNSWKKCQVEGPMFLYERSDGVKFYLFVFNRESTVNFSLPLYTSVLYKVESDYIMYQSENGSIHGIWFYLSEDRDRFFENIHRLCPETIYSHDINLNDSGGSVEIVNFASNGSVSSDGIEDSSRATTSCFEESDIDNIANEIESSTSEFEASEQLSSDSSSESSGINRPTTQVDQNHSDSHSAKTHTSGSPDDQLGSSPNYNVGKIDMPSFESPINLSTKMLCVTRPAFKATSVPSGSTDNVVGHKSFNTAATLDITKSLGIGSLVSEKSAGVSTTRQQSTTKDDHIARLIDSLQFSTIGSSDIARKNPIKFNCDSNPTLVDTGNSNTATLTDISAVFAQSILNGMKSNTNDLKNIENEIDSGVSHDEEEPRSPMNEKIREAVSYGLSSAARSAFPKSLCREEFVEMTLRALQDDDDFVDWAYSCYRNYVESESTSIESKKIDSGGK